MGSFAWLVVIQERQVSCQISKVLNDELIDEVRGRRGLWGDPYDAREN